MPRFSDDRQFSSPLEDGTESATLVADQQAADAGRELTDKDWATMFRGALDASSTYQQEKLRTPWSRNYRAFNNRHINGSKYESFKYRNRSKLFRPKTRMAVRKNLATSASALFSTDKVVSISPARASDPLQSMTARILHEVLNYRLDRANWKAGPNWFMTVMGARQDTQIAGRCVSKQFWEYEEREVPVFVQKPELDPNGLPVTDEMGRPSYVDDIDYDVEVIRDRPNCVLIPPEHAFIDPTGEWRDPIQEGGFFVAGFPTRKEDLEYMIAAQARRPRMGGGAWRDDIDIEQITQGAGTNQRQADAIRRSRDDGTDRYQSRHADTNGETIWLYEVFYRYAGTDWHWWMLGEQILLSDPRPVEESYPEQMGERPYTSGVGEIESHKVYPTSPVETWQPMQQEMNEVTNLGLDALKMSISPITKVRRGRNVDLKQIQNRGPDAHIMVEEIDDVAFDRAPSPPALIQQYLNNLNLDFDELAGVFSAGSVQSNRQMNETVGGMQLAASSSNDVTSFDLRVWVETWVEPTVRQLTRCIQRYESDEMVLAIAGEKAGLIVMPDMAGEGGIDTKDPAAGKVTISQVLGSMDSMPVTVRVEVGMGAMDSRQKMEKFMAGMKMTMELQPLLEREGYQLKASAVVQEAWGLVGYKDADKFYEKKAEGQQDPPPPEVQAEMMKQQGRMQEKQADGQTKVAVEQIRAQSDMEIERMKADLQAREQRLQEMEFAHQQRMDDFDMKMREADAQRQRMEGMMNSINDRLAQQSQPPKQ